jgi:hypothetical protein
MSVRRPDPFQSDSRTVPIKFYGSEAILQDIVEIGDPGLDHLVTPLRLSFGLSCFGLKRGDAHVDLGGPFSAARDNGGQDRRQPLRLEPSFDKMVSDEGFEFTHGN